MLTFVFFSFKNNPAQESSIVELFVFQANIRSIQMPVTVQRVIVEGLLASKQLWFHQARDLGGTAEGTWVSNPTKYNDPMVSSKLTVEGQVVWLRLSQIDGVERVAFNGYAIVVERAQVYDWSQIINEVTEALHNIVEYKDSAFFVDDRTVDDFVDPNVLYVGRGLELPAK